MADKSNDSHISTGARAETPPGPVRMHHENAMTGKSNGMTNPNGAAKGGTECKVGNSGGKTY